MLTTRTIVLLALPLVLAGCQDRDLPTGIEPSRPDFLIVSSPIPFTQVSAGGFHTCALRNDGGVECWGQATAPSGTFTRVSSGGNHTCALRSDGGAECWGYDGFGEATPPSGAFTQVSAGWFHTCALRSDGQAWCWGRNDTGQAPASRAAASGTFTQVSANGFHTCALRSDGQAECWGYNLQGQAPATRSGTAYTTTLLPTATFSTTPTQVVAGESFGVALDDAQVPGWPGPVTFTYAFDCGDGYGAFTASHSASCPTSTAGNRTVRGIVRDHHGHQREYTATVEVVATAPPVVSINPAGTLVKKTGAAVISGSVTCSAPTAVQLDATLHQQQQTNGRNATTVMVAGSGNVLVNCSGTTPWSVTLTPESGKFQAGAATAAASAPGATADPVTVQLK